MIYPKDFVNKIICGNCLEVLKQIPDKCVDLVLTDPPYNIARDNNFTTMGRAGIDFGEWDKNADILSWIKIAQRILTPDGSIIIFNDWKNLGDITKEGEKYGLVIKDFLRWIKPNPMPRNRDRRYITDYECAIWFVNKGAKWIFHRQNITYDRPEFKYGVDKKRLHPTQKPIKLMEHLLKIHSNEQQLVCDPFLGSGTTVVACKNLNRKYIGIELSEEYCKIAKKRINKIESDLFNQETM